MNEKDLREYLLAKYPVENEACEWKEFKSLKHAISGAKSEDIISYVSAIANVNGGHLVIGVEDKTLDIVGIKDFHGYTKDNICPRIIGNCTHLNSEIFQVEDFISKDTGKTVWVFHIPKHSFRLPVYAHGHPWQRLGDQLVPMRQERLDAILSEPASYSDWSAAIVEAAKLSDLDESAVQTAVRKFKERHKNQSWASQLDRLDTLTLLDRAKLTADGKITRAALLLLGNSQAEHLLSPNVAQITWKLDTDEKAYEHFGPPFILTTTELLRRIRNPSQKLFPNSQLLAVEIPKYETRTVLEAAHNCLAHQDYEKCERVLVTETADRLLFENAGGFFEGSPEAYFTGKQTPKRYRNHWLAHAMAQIGMIDAMGYGIHNMTLSQRERFLPLPSYRGSTPQRTRLEVLGRPIDLNYTQLLLERRDLDLDTVILLDRVQKDLPITDAAIKKLRRDELIEGRKPHIHVSRRVAVATETELSYVRSKGAQKSHLKNTVIAYLRKTGGSTRDKLDELLLPLLPGTLTDEQKRNRVKNLLTEMRRDKLIASDRETRGAVWTATKRSNV